MSGAGEQLKGVISGGVGGMCLVLAGHPFDLVKTRLQTAPPGAYPAGAMDVVRASLREGGARALFRGMSAPLMGVTPIFAICIWAYGVGKDIMRAATGARSDAELSLAHIGVAGALSAVPTTAVMAPGERIKVLLLVPRAPGLPPYAGPGDVVRQLVRAEGLGSLFRGSAITLLRERLQRFPGAPGRAAALAQLAGLYATALRDPARAAATFEESARSDLRGAGPRWLAAAEAWEEAGSRAHAIEALEAAEADPACAFAAAVSLGRLLLDLARNIGDLTVVIRGEGIADTATPESRGARIVDLMGAPPKVEQAPPPEPIVVIRQVRKTETPIEEIRGGRIIQNKSLD
jgi:hypothetical protein